MGDLLQDLRYALRQLRRGPGVAAVAIASLALGVGANAAVFSLCEWVLLRSLPVPEPERLVNLSAAAPKPGSKWTGTEGGIDSIFSYPMFRDLEKGQRALTGLAAHRLIEVNVTAGDRTLPGSATLVSGSYFPVLGVRPALGRLLRPDDDHAVGAQPVAVLSHGFWQTRMGADRSVLGRTVRVNGLPLTVVGVAAPGFEGTTLGQRPDLFAPLTMHAVLNPGYAGFTDYENRDHYWLYLFGRLQPGATLEQARDDLNRVYRPVINEVEAPLLQGWSDEGLARFRAQEVAVGEGRRGQSVADRQVRTPLILLFGITGIVLLIACANIANLLLARGADRGHEMAVRGSLGAGRAQLLRQLLTESCLLAVAGGVASLAVARAILSASRAFLPEDLGTFLDVHLDPRVLVFVATLSLGTGLLFGLYPALYATRPGLAAALRAGTREPGGARSAARFRTSLVTAQIGLAMVLLIAAGLFVQSVVNVGRVDLGVRAEHLVTFRISPQRNGYEPDAARTLYERVGGELAAIPGVTSVAAAVVPILSHDNWTLDVSVEGFDAGPDTDLSTSVNEVGVGYFRTLGMPLLAGREFTEVDAAPAGAFPRVAIVNEAFARKFGLAPSEVVGKWIGEGRGDAVELDIEIVGLVRDASYSEVKQDVPPVWFLPLRRHEDQGTLTFYARTAIEPDSVVATIAAIMRRLDPNLPVEDLKTLSQQVRENVSQDRLISTFSAAFAALATLLAAIGLYGMLAYAVAQRTREIGLRMALGAGTGQIRGMVLRQVGRMLLAGGAIGIAAALVAGRAARSLLFGVEGHDPKVVATAALVLALVALAAGWLPARRATRVDPMTALRTE